MFDYQTIGRAAKFYMEKYPDVEIRLIYKDDVIHWFFYSDEDLFLWDHGYYAIGNSPIETECAYNRMTEDLIAFLRRIVKIKFRDSIKSVIKRKDV